MHYVTLIRVSRMLCYNQYYTSLPKKLCSSNESTNYSACS